MGQRLDPVPTMSDNESVEEVTLVSVNLRVLKRRQMPEPGGVPALLREWRMYDSSQENVWVLAFDVQGNIRKVTRVAQGSYGAVDVPLPAVITAVALAATDRFWLVHNHPGGAASPSPADVDLTEKVMNAANTAGMRMEDHLIIAPPDGVFSFREARMIRDVTTTQSAAVAASANEIALDPVRVAEHRTDVRG